MKRVTLNILIAALCGVVLGWIYPLPAKAQQQCDSTNGSQLGVRYKYTCTVYPQMCSSGQECEQDYCNANCPGGWIKFCVGILYCGQARLTGCQGYTCASPAEGK